MANGATPRLLPPATITSSMTRSQLINACARCFHGPDRKDHRCPLGSSHGKGLHRDAATVHRPDISDAGRHWETAVDLTPWVTMVRYDPTR